MSNDHIISVKASVQIPRCPNYIMHATLENYKFDVADLTDDDLRAIGIAWTEQLVSHAQDRRARKTEP